MFFRRLKQVFFRKPSKREIFGYWDGEQYVYADPQEIIERLEDHPVYRPDVHIKDAEKEGPAGKEAWAICLDAWRRAFNVKVYDPATQVGLTQAEINALYGLFCVYTEALKKSIEPTVTQLESMAATLKGSGEPTTSGTSATSSTKSDKRGESLTEPDAEASTQSSPSKAEAPHP